jgi:hypothetical protein
MNFYSSSFCGQRDEEDLENFELLDRTDKAVRSKALSLIFSVKASGIVRK